MRLRRLRIRSLPGITSEFTLEAKPGLNLVVGPNGSGKSSILRAVFAVLWPRHASPSPLDVESWWQLGKRRFHGARYGSGPTRWQAGGEDIPPPNLPRDQVAGCYRLGLLDLFKADAGRTDAALAARIRNLMAGGYDLAAAAAAFEVPRQPGARKVAELRKRRENLRRLGAERRDLAAQEDSLAGLREDLAVVESAAARLPLWQQARQVAESRRLLVRAEAAVGDCPAGLANLTGEEADLLGQLQKDLASDEEECNRCRQAIATARAVEQQSELPAGPVPEEKLAIQNENTRRLADLARDLRQARREETEAAAALAKATAQLADPGEPDRHPRPEAETLAEIESLLERASTTGWHQEGLARVLEQLPAQPLPTTVETLRAAVGALENWLAVKGQGFPRRLITPLVLLKVLAIWGLKLVSAGQALGWLALGGGLAGIVTLVLLGRLRPAWRGCSRSLNDCRRDFRRTELAEPVAWKPEPVLARLAELRSELARAEVHQASQEIRQGLTAEMQRLQEKSARLAGQQKDLWDRVAADPASGPARLLDFLRRLENSHQRRQAHEAAAAATRHLEQELAAGLEAVNTFLGKHGKGPATDPGEAQASLDDLARTSDKLRAARTNLEREGPRLKDLQQKIDERREQRRVLFERAHLEDGDLTGLESLLRRLDEYRRNVENRNHLQRKLAEDLAALRAQPGYESQPGLADLAAEQVERLAREDKTQAGREMELRDRISQIKERIDRARHSAELENALAAVEEAAADLSRVREDALFNATARFLLDRVREGHEARSQPAVLARASDLLAHFTRGSLRLQVTDSEEGPVFRALDTAGEVGLSLTQLSDGTRAQLLLAARLAFILESEEGGRDGGGAGSRPPIFLDESLAASDPARFRAIAASLLDLGARQHRQIFYLTANPGDVLLWQELSEQAGLDPAEPVDLARVRRLAGAAGPAELLPAGRPQIPSPKGLSPEEYGELLLVPLLDARAPASSAHLFHLLTDDLALLHGLLRLGIENVGQWRNFAGLDLNRPPLSPAKSTLLSARADAWLAFVDTWRLGRGRPVDREALALSGAVSDRFLPEVLHLANQLDGDGEQLLQALREGRVKDFRQKKADQLEDFLAGEGFLDPRPPLDEDGVRNEVLRAVKPHLESGILDLAAVARQVRSWWDSVAGRG